MRSKQVTVSVHDTCMLDTLNLTESAYAKLRAGGAQDYVLEQALQLIRIKDDSAESYASSLVYST